METYNLLDCLVDVHLFALHYIFIPRINRALGEFIRQYNNHPLRTEHNMTPLQLYLASPTSVDLMLPDTTTYGVEEDGPYPDIESPDGCVIVVPPACVVTPDVQALLPDPLMSDGNYGIDLYLQALTILQN